MSSPSHLFTSHGQFLLPSTSSSLPPTTLILRGVNLSSTSKFPTVQSYRTGTYKSDRPNNQLTREQRDGRRNVAAGHRSHLSEEEVRFWSEAEQGGRDGWFVDHPFPVDQAAVHLERLKEWGFTTIRYIIPWEALEHAGPGKYDESFIDYTIELLRKCREYGFRIFISPHQDCFSRFISGSGAPYWVLLALGIHPRRIHQTGSAILHQCFAKEGFGGEEGIEQAKENKLPEWPDMIWNTNLHRLASRHCFTMFFASEDFAPNCTIDHIPAGEWVRNHFNEAYGHLADRLRDAGDILDDCVIGWDSMNEPQEGFIGVPDLNTFPESQNFKKGPSPTPAQGFRLGLGQAVNNIEYGDFTSTGQKKRGTVTITPPGGKGVWLTKIEAREAEERWGWKWGNQWDFWDDDGQGGCPWAGHEVWDTKTGNVLEKAHFHKAGKEPADFIEDYWKKHYTAFISRIRQAHPHAISFINPPVFKSPPDLSEHVKQGRMALSSHFYDGMTLLNKRRHIFNADAVGLQRGLTNILSAIKFGTDSIRSTLRDELGELKSDARKSEGLATDEDGGSYPTIIGELGIPFDMKETKLFGLAKGKTDWKDYKEPAKSMDQLLNACDGTNALSYTIWIYEPFNTHANGDGWNGEDLSLISYDEVDADDDLLIDSPPDLKTLTRLGSRAVESWCRPYPSQIMGKVKEFTFDMKTGEFNLVIVVSGLDQSQLWKYENLYGSTDERSKLESGEQKQQSTTTNTSTMSSSSRISKEVSSEKDKVLEQGSTLIYLPYIHYIQENPSTTNFSTHIVGQPNETKEEWIKGKGVANIEFDLIELSEGTLNVSGQWAKWEYPLYESGEREIKLKLRKWVP